MTKKKRAGAAPTAEKADVDAAFKPFEAEIKLFQIIDFMLCQTTLPMAMMDSLNVELDRLRADTDRGSHAHTLVGQIKRGEQLTLSRENPVFGKVYAMVEQLAMTYVEAFGKLTSLTEEIPWVGAQCKDLWSVHMFSGDYNPMHDHGSDTEAGMSFVFWTRVPENMRNTEVDNLFDSSGYLDGCIKFFNGPFAQRGPMQFRAPKVLDIVPEPGKFVIFPHWLNHTVYPFDADGERTTISGNVNLFAKTPEEMEKERAENDKAPEAVS